MLKIILKAVKKFFESKWIKFPIMMVLLSSCVTNSTLPNDVQFDPTSQKAMVVLGFGCKFWATSCELGIGKLKQNGEIDFSVPQIKPQNYGIFTENSQKNMAGLINYNLYITDPGEYSLVYFSSDTPPTHKITTVHKKDKPFIKLNLQPGKIHYIGEISVNVLDFPGQIISIKHNIDRMEEYMNQYKNIKDPIIITKFEIYSQENSLK